MKEVVATARHLSLSLVEDVAAGNTGTLTRQGGGTGFAEVRHYAI
jgi:hypothetical protein